MGVPHVLAHALHVLTDAVPVPIVQALVLLVVQIAVPLCVTMGVGDVPEIVKVDALEDVIIVMDAQDVLGLNHQEVVETIAVELVQAVVVHVPDVLEQAVWAIKEDI